MEECSIWYMVLYGIWYMERKQLHSFVVIRWLWDEHTAKDGLKESNFPLSIWHSIGKSILEELRNKCETQNCMNLEMTWRTVGCRVVGQCLLTVLYSRLAIPNQYNPSVHKFWLISNYSGMPSDCQQIHLHVATMLWTVWSRIWAPVPGMGKRFFSYP
jgi:hypothetical protein